MPARDDLLLRAGAAPRRRAGRGWEPLVTSARYDPRPLPAASKRRRADRHGADRALRRLGRAHQRHGRRAARRRRARADRARSGSSPPRSPTPSSCSRRAPAGCRCFLVPRLREDGALNGLRFDRLKPKLGNRSNPTAEVELDGARGVLVGEEGRGVRRDHGDDRRHAARLRARLDGGDAARHGGGDPLGRAPRRRSGAGCSTSRAMRAVLADLALESEAATAGALRLARAHEQAHARRRRRRAAAAHRGAGAQVLDLQARAGARRRGARVPGRLRLHRGVAPGARLPRGAADVGLGGLGQRAGARRAARRRRRRRDARGAAGRARRGARRRPAARRGGRRDPALDARDEAGRAAPGRAARALPAGRAARAPRAARGRRRVLRDAPRRRRRRARRSASCRPASTRAAIVERAGRDVTSVAREGRRDPAARRARRGRAQPRAPRGPDRPGRARALARRRSSCPRA